MKKPVLLTALLAAAVLSGCSWLRLGDASDAAIGQDPSSPRLSVSGGKLKVSLDPLRFTRKDGAVTITSTPTRW